MGYGTMNQLVKTAEPKSNETHNPSSQKCHLAI